MKAAEWIDHVKDVRGWESDYRAAKELGLGRATISKYRSKPTTTLDDETVAKVAGALNIEPEYIALDQWAERTPVDAIRKGVTRLLERIGGKARAGGGPAGGARDPIDITSAASTSPGGDPSGSGSAIAPKYTSHHRPLATLAEWVARIVTPSTDTGFALA